MKRSGNGRGASGWFAAWTLSAALFGVLAAVTWRYHFQYPFSDEWTFIPLLVKALEGEAGWRDYWAPYHGHRLLFSRLVMIPVAVATQWDTRWFVAGNLVLGAALFGLCLAMARRAFRRAESPLPPSFPPLAAVLIFSLNQWCNWAWGWQILVYMSVVAVVLGIALLAARPLGTAAYLVAVACGVVASFSFATGIVFWAVGFAMLLAPRLDGERIRPGYIAAWLAVTLAVFTAYIAGFNHPEYHDSGGFLPENPLVLVPYTLAYIGASLTFFVPVDRFGWDPAWLAGLLGLAAAAALHGSLIRRRIPAAVWAPFTGLMLFALGSGLLTGLGRSAQFGARQAAAARYFTISELFWVALIVLLLLAVHSGVGAKPWRWPIRGALAAIVVAALLSGRLGYYKLDEHYKVYMPEARRMVADKLEEVPARLNPRKESLAAELAALKRWELFCFRPEAFR